MGPYGGAAAVHTTHVISLQFIIGPYVCPDYLVKGHYCSTKISSRLPSSRSCKSNRRPVVPLSIARITFCIVPSLSCDTRRANRCRLILIRYIGMVAVTFIFLRLVAISVIQIRKVRFCIRPSDCSCSGTRVSNSCAACTAVIWPNSIMFRMRLRSSVEVGIILTFQQPHRFLDADLLSSQAIKYETAISTTIALWSAAECSYDFVEAATSGVISNIQVLR